MNRRILLVEYNFSGNEKGRTLKRILKWVFGIAAALVIIGLLSGEFSDMADTQDNVKKESAVISNDPPFETSASEIASAYSENAETADKKYKNKAIIVAGSVVELKTDPSGNAVLVLEGGVNPLSEPHFILAESEKSKAAELKKGQKVKLTCFGKGEIAKVAHAEDCELLFIDWS